MTRTTSAKARPLTPRAGEAPRKGLLEEWIDRHFVAISAALLVLMVAVQFASVAQESLTNDEPLHLASGYSYLVTGDYRMDSSHPAFARMLAAVPLLFMNLDAHLDTNAWKWADCAQYADLLVYHNRVSADSILLSSRAMIIGLSAALGIWMAWWTRRHFGSSVALLSLAFLSFDPNIIAHGRYVTTDLPVTLFVFVTCTLWADYLWAPSWKKLLATSLALGLALASKYSAVFLIPVLPLVYCVAWFSRRDRRSLSLRGLASTFAVVSLLSTAVVALVYAPEVIGSIRYAITGVRPANVNAQPLADAVAKDGALGNVLASVASKIHLPAFRYLIGLSFQTSHAATGQPAYLLGQFSTVGWWNYFPVAFLVKTPTATLLACLLALVAVLVIRRRLPKAALILWISIAPLVYFAATMISHLDIGVRHILPVYPFLYVVLAVALYHCVRPMLREWFLLTVVLLVSALGVESLATYPDYLSFFNWASGGPDEGSQYLLDSNIDWGQDLKKLSQYLEQNNSYPVCAAIFGLGPTALTYYGIQRHDLGWPVVTPGWHSNCVAAVSVNFLHGLYGSQRQFALLRQRTPDAVLGHSVYIYDLRSK
jgi:hypothetical protein